MNDVLNSALSFHDAGFSVIPAKLDGTKAPLVEWKRYQLQRAPRDQLNEWFAGGHPGMGVILGHISQNAVMLEWEGRAVREGLFAQFLDAAETCGLADVTRRVMTGYTEVTPSGGIHLIYRVAGPVEKNTKLAQRIARDEELTGQELALRDAGKTITRVLIETRGEGGFAVCAPSHGATHPSERPWTLMHGHPDTVSTVTADEHHELLTLCRTFDQMPAPELPPERAAGGTGAVTAAGAGDLGPGEAFSNDPAVTWSSILEPAGWTRVHDNGHRATWRRPGKDRGVSAHTGGNPDLMYVYSTSTVLPDSVGISKWRAYAFLHCGGDFSRAASELRGQGFGSSSSTVESTRLPLPSLAGAVLVSKTEVDSDGVAVGGDDSGEGGDSGGDSGEKKVLWWRDELRGLPEPQWLIDGVLAESSYILLSGRRSSFKSFQALDWALHLATGRAWNGRSAQKLRVLYMSGEGSSGIGKRVDAWETYHGTRVDNDQFALLEESYNLFTDLTTQWWVDLVKEGRFGLVVIDTLRRVSGRAKQNDNTDMGIVVDNIERVKRAVDGSGSVIVVAHTGKGEDADTRGASCIEDDADVVWYSERTDKEQAFYTIRNGKMKNSEDGEEIHMYAKWTGESLVSVPDPRVREENNTSETDFRLKLIDIFKDMFGNSGCTRHQFVELLVSEYRMSRPTVYRALNQLVDQGSLVANGTARSIRLTLGR